tara:strand:+ start:122 stop:307 length:186 start_codon:yes stop_codon:yes gene_type:complete
VKVGDLVRFHYDHRWTGVVEDWGYGLIDKIYDGDTYKVVWPEMGFATRTLGSSCLEVVNAA